MLVIINKGRQRKILIKTQFWTVLKTDLSHLWGAPHSLRNTALAKGFSLWPGIPSPYSDQAFILPTLMPSSFYMQTRLSASAEILAKYIFGQPFCLCVVFFCVCDDVIDDYKRPETTGDCKRAVNISTCQMCWLLKGIVDNSHWFIARYAQNTPMGLRPTHFRFASGQRLIYPAA